MIVLNTKLFWLEYRTEEYFWPIRQIFGQISTSKIPKFEEILGKNSKFGFFFSCVGGGRSKCPNIKKTFSVVALVFFFKALQLILGAKMILKNQKLISKEIRISHF